MPSAPPEIPPGLVAMSSAPPPPSIPPSDPMFYPHQPHSAPMYHPTSLYDPNVPHVYQPPMQTHTSTINPAFDNIHNIHGYPQSIPPTSQHAQFPEQYNQLVPMNQQPLNIAFYTPTASNSPLMMGKSYFLFNFFVRNFGGSMTLIHRVPSHNDILFNSMTDRRGLENFWTYDAPLMALNHPHVLNAMLALASIHFSTVTGESPADAGEFNSMTYYQNAVRGLREDIALQRHTDTLATLTTCLLLAFYETMYGDLVKWYQHMTGARDIIVALDVCKLAAGAQSVYNSDVPRTSLSPSEITAVQACDLLASFLYMEVIQCAIGNTQLLLPFHYWQTVPFRRCGTARVYIFDQLLRHSARIGSWVATDTLRKEKLYPKDETPPEFTDKDQQEQDQARLEWLDIKQTFTEFNQKFADYLNPIQPTEPRIITPFGPCAQYQTSVDHCLAAFLHMNWLILKRNNPDVPVYGYQTLKYTAMEGVPHVIAVFRSLPPSVPHTFGQLEGENLDNGQIVRLLIAMSVAGFFAGIQLRDPIQQDWIVNWFNECYNFTGWFTTKKIIQGLYSAWSYQKAGVGEVPSASSPTSANPSANVSTRDLYSTTNTSMHSSPSDNSSPPELGYSPNPSLNYQGATSSSSPLSNSSETLTPKSDSTVTYTSTASNSSHVPPTTPTNTPDDDEQVGKAEKNAYRILLAKGLL